MYHPHHSIQQQQHQQHLSGAGVKQQDLSAETAATPVVHLFSVNQPTSATGTSHNYTDNLLQNNNGHLAAHFNPYNHQHHHSTDLIANYSNNNSNSNSSLSNTQSSSNNIFVDTCSASASAAAAAAGIGFGNNSFGYGFSMQDGGPSAQSQLDMDSYQYGSCLKSKIVQQQYAEVLNSHQNQIGYLNCLGNNLTTGHSNTNTLNNQQQQHQQMFDAAFQMKYQRQNPLFQSYTDTNALIGDDKSQAALMDMKCKRKVKKSRVLFSQWQINELEKLFKKQKYVTSNERDLMAKRLKLQANQVKIWFQNRRYKIKKRNEVAKETTAASSTTPTN